MEVIQPLSDQWYQAHTDLNKSQRNGLTMKQTNEGSYK